MIRSLQKALNPQTLRGNLLFKLLIVLSTFQHASLTPDVSSCTSITSGKFWQQKLIKGWKHSFICEQHQHLDNRKHQQTFLHQSKMNRAAASIYKLPHMQNHKLHPALRTEKVFTVTFLQIITENIMTDSSWSLFSFKLQTSWTLNVSVNSSWNFQELKTKLQTSTQTNVWTRSLPPSFIYKL